MTVQIMENIRKNGYATIQLGENSILYKIRDIVDSYDEALINTHPDEYHHSLLQMQNNINNLSPQEEFANELYEAVFDICGSENIGLSSTVYCRGVRPQQKTNVMVESYQCTEIFYTDLDYANHQINIHIPVKNYNDNTCILLSKKPSCE